jgi:outer membrane protein
MNVRKLLAIGLAASALSPLGSVASAQPAGGAAAPAQPPITQGPPIAGYCVFSLNEIIGGSKVGQSVLARLKVLGGQVDAELQPEADAIRTEDRALQGQASTMDQATLQARQANLQLRATNFEKRRELRQREMQATQEKQFDVILRELNPIMRALYQQRSCSVLVDGDAGGVRIVNPAMDLSGAAVSALDQKIQTLTFDREHLDVQPAAAPAAH